MESWLPTILICVVILLAAGWLYAALRGTRKSPEQDQAMSMLQNQVNASAQHFTQQMEQLRGAVQEINSQVVKSLQSTQKDVGERIDNTTKLMHGVSKQMVQMDEAAKRIYDVGKDISTLEQTLRAPKLRGNLGELFLGELLGQILPPKHFQMQHAFKDGQAVDAVIRMNTGLVPVDSKFPLENFRKLLSAESDADKKSSRKLFVQDVKKHIDAIASKYIRTDEGTFDFALMYIPAENVYYETIIKEDEPGTESELFNYALKKRVIPVSPNSLYAYLQTIVLGLKGMRVEEGAREIINHLSRLQKEFEKFNEAFQLVGKHLDNSKKQYEQAASRYGKVEGKLENIDSLVRGLEGGPSSLPPADES